MPKKTSRSYQYRAIVVGSGVLLGGTKRHVSSWFKTKKEADDWAWAIVTGNQAADRDIAFVTIERRHGNVVESIKWAHAGEVEVSSSATLAKPKQAHSSKRPAAVKKVTPKATPQAIAFFKKNAGGSKGPKESWAQARARGAKQLAEAEAIAAARGWSVEWEHDPDPQRGEGEEDFEMLVAVLRDDDNNVLASTGSVGMSGNAAQDRAFGRVIEAELALEALSEQR